jgi:hypothetical protein
MCEQAAFGSGYDHMAGCCKLEMNLQLHKILEGFNHLSDPVSREQFYVNVLKYIKHSIVCSPPYYIYSVFTHSCGQTFTLERMHTSIVCNTIEPPIQAFSISNKKEGS